MFDYVPSNTVFSDSATATSSLSSWSIHYRVAGASSSEIWQTPLVDSATMVRFTRARRLDPASTTVSETLTIRIRIQ